MEIAGGDPGAGPAALAVVAEGRVAEAGLAVGCVGDRPAGEVAGGRERRRDDLEAVEGGSAGELGVECAHDLLGRLPEPGPEPAVGNRDPLRLALLGGLRGGADSVAATALRQVLRGIGGGEQLRRRCRLGHRLGDAAGDRERIVLVVGEYLLRAGGERCDRRVGALGGVTGPALEQDAELVTADPADERARVGGGGADERVTDPLERIVTGRVPVRVVDRLEPVDVAEHHRQLGGPGRVTERRPVEPFLERPPVRQGRQRVLVSHPRYAGEHLRARDDGGDLRRDRLQEADVGGAERRVAGGGRRPDRAPAVALDLDRDAHVGRLLELPQQLDLSRVGVGVVDRREVGLAALRQFAETWIGADLVGLVGRQLLLAGAEVADVDQDPVEAVLVLEAADRKRRRPDRRARFGRGQLEDLVEVVRRRRGGDDPQQRFSLFGSKGRGTHHPPIGTRIPDC